MTHEEIIQGAQVITEPVVKDDNGIYHFRYPKEEMSFSLPWDALLTSGSLTSFGRQSRTKPIDSWEFIELIEAALRTNDILYERKPLIINEMSCKSVLSKNDKQIYKDAHIPMEKWIFNKLILHFKILDEKGGLYPGIAVKVTEKGFEVVFGLQVGVCDNYCIFGNRRIFATFQNPHHDSIHYESIIIQIGEWLRNYQQELAMDRTIIKMLIGTPFDMQGQFFDLIGRIYDRARGRNEDQILGDNNLGKFYDRIKPKITGELSAISNLWGLYNLFTAIIKPEKQKMDIGNIFSNHLAWSDFIFNEYIPDFESKKKKLNDDLSKLETQINEPVELINSIV